MAGITYKPDLAGTRQGMTSPDMLAAMIAAAEAGQRFAEGIAPRRTGDYAGSFRVEGSTHGGPRRDRAEARLVNESGHAAAVEWKNNGGERILGRTVDFIEGNGAG